MNEHLDATPQPWSRNDIKMAISKDFQTVRASIDQTEGGRLWRALEDLQDTIWIFQSSATDLLDEICLFGDRSKSPAFWHPANANDADSHSRQVKKKVFQCTSALMALVAHARNFKKQTPVSGYSEKLAEIFCIPGLHDFLQRFRNYNTHWRIAEMNWIIKFSGEARIARFTVSRAELLTWEGWTKNARIYIDGVSDAVDVYDVFIKYREQVLKFYSWHKGAVLTEYAGVLQHFHEYKRLHEGIQRTLSWNLVISHAPKTLNPYGYLDRYFTKNQFERLLAYEANSEQRVDALIRMLEMEEFCDDSLRDKIIQLFRNNGEQ